MPNIIRDGLCFDDVLLVPQHSTIASRSTIDVTVKLNHLHYTHPIIPANMKTITGKDMALKIINSGGLAILHRFMSVDEQINIAKSIINCGATYNFAVSVGIDTTNIKSFYDIGVRIICIDIAHGDSKHCIETISWIKNKYPYMFIIAGNIATGGGAERLWRAGADAVKCGIGPGSICSTRIQTGNGIPQLTALIDVSSARLALSMSRPGHGSSGPLITKPMYIISDGGCKNSGDLVKALCFADMVMVGNLFAGCEETPGKILEIDGISYKEYVGSSTYKTNHIEGVAALVHTKGSYQSVLNKLLEGLRSGMSYQGAHNLTELMDNSEFIRISNAGLKESHPHDIAITK